MSSFKLSSDQVHYLLILWTVPLDDSLSFEYMMKGLECLFEIAGEVVVVDWLVVHDVLLYWCSLPATVHRPDEDN
jgi:hypothetical protein